MCRFIEALSRTESDMRMIERFKLVLPNLPHCKTNEVPTWMYRRGIKYTCDTCKLKERLADKKGKVLEDWDTKEKEVC